MPRFETLGHSLTARRCLGALGLIGLAGAAWMALAAASFAPDSQPDGWINRPVLSSYNVAAGNQVVYRAEYRVGEWSGAIWANYIDAGGDIQDTSPWAASNASVIIDTQHYDTGRLIVTRNGATSVPFRWASLSATQQGTLGTSTTGQQILNYVRGDRTNEDPAAAKLRARATVLGDIQHSTLLYWQHSDGNKRLYVGANDGMLHVLDAATGREVFAYVPSMLIPRLKNLAANPYVHTLFVDGSLALSEVALASGTKTLLAGTLGGGGKGLFMLDVTDPSASTEAAAAAKIKWEITNASTGYTNLGYTYAAPKLARLNNGSAAVIVGNGYVNSGSGRATLLLIDADTGALIREIDTGSGTTAAPNGLSSATLVDTNDDGKVDMAYAGDIDGKLWRFDLTAAAPSGYSATLVYTTSPAQAITVAPVVAPHPSGGRMVLFGTGRMLTAADSTDTAGFAAYGIWDGAPAANTTLISQTLTETTYNGRKLRYASANVPNWASGGNRGWKLTLPAGERVVGEAPFFNDDRFYFTSTNPTVAAAAADKPKGMNWMLQLNYLTGGTVPASVFDINDDTLIDTNDKVGGQVIIGRQLGAGIYSQPVLLDLTSRSLTLFNQQSGLSEAGATVADPGVSGGHFDVTFFYRLTQKSKLGYQRVKHTHEYDDKYDVTGVNFLNASATDYNLSNPVPSTSTQFKVLVANQYLNPAALLSVGGAGFVSVKNYGQLATQTVASTLLASLPTYSRSTINTLMFKLPLDGFKSIDWWGDGGPVRAGLLPTQPSCVYNLTATGAPDSPSRNGKNGERLNGALTIQIIAANTPASALELNYPAGGAKYGWRVKLANFSYVIAEYAAYWHHDNGYCYGESGWVQNPPQDTSPHSTTGRLLADRLQQLLGLPPAAPAAGSADPKDGAFNTTVPNDVTVVSTTTTITGNTTVTTIVYSDGKTSTTTITANGNGTETVVLVDRTGNSVSLLRSISGTAVRGAEEALQGTRRISWRELNRQ